MIAERSQKIMGKRFCFMALLRACGFSRTFLVFGGCVSSQQMRFFLYFPGLEVLPAVDTRLHSSFFWTLRLSLLSDFSLAALASWCLAELCPESSFMLLFLEMVRRCASWLNAPSRSSMYFLRTLNNSLSSASSMSLSLSSWSLYFSSTGGRERFSCVSSSMISFSSWLWADSCSKEEERFWLLLAATFLRAGFLLRLRERRAADLVSSSRRQKLEYSLSPWRMMVPARWREARSKGDSSSLVSEQSPLETQKVKVMGMASLRIMQARAVVRLCSLIELMHFSQSNIESCLLRILTSTRDLRQCGEPSGWSGPQQNRFFFEEWLWKSKKNSGRCRCFFSLCTSATKPLTSGQRKLPTWSNCLLRSLPLKLVRQLPATTPSGFIIGSTQKLQVASSLEATVLGVSRARTKPSSMCEELVSPGWMRAVITTLAFFWPLPLEMLSRGSSSPLKLSQAAESLTKGCGLMSSRNCRRSEQVQGMEQAKQTSMFYLLKSNLNCSWLAVLPVPYLQSRSTNCVSQQYCCDHSLALMPGSTTLQQGFMPLPQRFLRFTILQMLSCTVPTCLPLLTLKQNQLVCPFVLVSLRMKQSYSFRLTRTARSRLPLSKLESKASSCRLPRALTAKCGGPCQGLPIDVTASAMRLSLTWYRYRYFQRQLQRWCS